MGEGYVAEGNRADIGSVTTISQTFGFDYSPISRLGVSGNVSFLAVRYNGKLADTDSDNGEFNFAPQDASLDVRYEALSSFITVTPSLGFTLPTHDYQHMGHSNVGHGLKEARLGVSVGYQPEFLVGAYLDAKTSYSFVERGSFEKSTNRLDLDGEAGYYINEKLSVSGLFSFRRTFAGWDWADHLIDELQYEYKNVVLTHDQAAKAQFFQAGLGANYSLTERFSLSGTVTKTLWGANTTDLTAFSLGLVWNAL